MYLLIFTLLINGIRYGLFMVIFTDYSDQDSFVIALVAPYFSTRLNVMNSKIQIPQCICIADSWQETMEYSTENDRPCQFIE